MEEYEGLEEPTLWTEVVRPTIGLVSFGLLLFVLLFY